MALILLQLWDNGDTRGIVMTSSSISTITTTTTTTPTFLPTQFQRAFEESLGFFDDITEAHWQLRKNLTMARIHEINRTGLSKGALTRIDKDPSVWYQVHWDPDFSCFHETSLGGPNDGHKWVCDPHRLAHQRKGDCLVYSIGSNGDFRFERDLQEMAPYCEIHVFDPGNYSHAAVSDWHVNVTYHAIGLKASYEIPLNLTETSFSLGNLKSFEDSGSHFKTLPEIQQELGHVGRRIDVFKIDCEGCEFRTYKDWLDVDIGQLLVETHRVPPVAQDFFRDLHDAGFVLFHKEPNIMHSNGECIEFSFLRLDSSFFEAEENDDDLALGSVRMKQ
jgi:hypothetical protein